MKEIFDNYLTFNQYNKICKYWKIIEKISHKINQFKYVKYKTYDVYDDEEEILKCIKYNKKLDKYFEEQNGKLNYFQQEYEKYINSIGFKLNDRTYDESIFSLLNDGIVID